MKSLRTYVYSSSQHTALVAPAHQQQLPGGGAAADRLVDVDGEESAGGVEDGGQVGHQRGQHHRHLPAGLSTT